MIGKSFHDLTILKLLGSGGMGKVYLAMQKSLDRQVAVKVITSNSLLPLPEQVAERFLREAKIAASIQHPNVVNVYSAGKEENFLYIVMEYVQGSSLDTEISRGPLSETLAWNIALQICNALESALQNQKIIHRDVKPGNILLTGKHVAKLADFGLSKKTGSNTDSSAGIIVGTPNYICPEQAGGESVDFRGDIYSLGATIYHALTGHVVFTGDTILDTIFKHTFELVTLPTQYVPSLRKESVAILGKMLNKKKNDRYTSYHELALDIGCLLENKSLALVNDRSAYMVYKEDNQSKSLMSSLFSFASTPAAPTWSGKTGNEAKQRPNHFILVSDLSSSALQRHFSKYSPLKASIMAVRSVHELKVYLKMAPSVLILDNNFLGPQIVDFCNDLKKEFANNPLLLLFDNLPPHEKTAPGLLFVSYGGSEEQLAKILPLYLANVPCTLRDINLQSLLTMARYARWSTDIYVNLKAEDPGRISINHGSIVSAQQQTADGNLEGEEALQSLLHSEENWQTMLPQGNAYSANEKSDAHEMTPRPPSTRTPQVALGRAGENPVKKPTQDMVQQAKTSSLQPQQAAQGGSGETIALPATDLDALLRDIPDTPNKGTIALPAVPARHNKILVVEDDRCTQKILQFILEHNQYQVAVAEDGVDALMFLGREKFDIILADVNMPNLNGFELLKITKNKHIEVPLIFVAGIIQKDEEKKAMDAGAVAYITKPIVPDMLLQKVAEILAERPAQLQESGKRTL